MTTFLYSEIDYGETVAFDADTDVLSFDSAGLSAADFTLDVLSGDAGIQFTGGSKIFTLTGVDLSSLGEGTVLFADGSMLVNSCPANDFALDLSGTVHDDLLLGSPKSTIDLKPVAGSSAGMCAISADGRYVAFDSSNQNLVDNDTNDVTDVFLKDLQTGEIIRVSTSTTGDQAIDWSTLGSTQPALSADGGKVLFESWATNLVTGDTNRCADVFVKDVASGVLVRVSESSNGTQGNNTSTGAAMSSDGRYVAFTSYASNLVANDTNRGSDVFVKDLATGSVTLVSSSATGVQGNADAEGNGSFSAMISGDGHLVVFNSLSSNLVAGDDNGSADVFVKNVVTGEITCVSTDADGQFTDGKATDAAMSADGRYVVFRSDGALLHDGQDGTGAIYQRDLQTGELVRVAGAAPQFDWWGGHSVAMSADGRYVVFNTSAALLEGDTNGKNDVYVKDM